MEMRLREQKKKIFAEELRQNKPGRPMGASGSLSTLLSPNPPQPGQG